TNEEIRRKAGLGNGKSRLMSKSKVVGRLFGESLTSLDAPPRGAGRRDNGGKPVCGDRAVRGFERGED
ncbi:unnamed protein product, partial [marine sediment metagenome]